MTPKLPDPVTCRQCGGKSRVIDSRLNHRRGYRWRRRECAVCRQRWPTYETLVNPRHLVRRADLACENHKG